MLTVILSGGASRRMGRDKALLPYGGTTMLQHLIDKYAVLGEVAVSVNEAGRFPLRGALELTDPFPGEGPLNGIVAAFSQTDAAEIFLTATDLPCGEPAAARRLAALRGAADACVLRGADGRDEPLFAVYGRSCAPAAQACLASGKRSFKALFEQLDVRYVNFDRLGAAGVSRMLTNVNTPEEYAALE